MTHPLLGQAMNGKDENGKKQAFAMPRTLPVSRLRKKSGAAIISGPVWVDVEHLRKVLGESQNDFWSRFGVTQSTGSRYEDFSIKIPCGIHMLIVAFVSGMLSENDLMKLRDAVNFVDQ